MNDLISQNMQADPNNPRRNVSWASPNGLQTTGVMNPLGLKQNDPSVGYFGATPPQSAAGIPGAPGGTANQAAVAAAGPAMQAQPPATPNPSMSLLGPQGQSPEQSRYNQLAAQYGQGYQASSVAQANPNASNLNLPPDQRGFEGTFNPTTGMTGYGTPNGVELMDQSGNWFDASGKPKIYGQPSPPPPATHDLITGGRPLRPHPLPTPLDMNPAAGMTTGLRRPGMSNRGGLSRRVPGY